MWSYTSTPPHMPSWCRLAYLLPCNLSQLLLACKGSTPGFSTSAFSCSQTQITPCFGTFLHHEKACLKKTTGLCYITLTCITSNRSLEITTKHRKYARYGTSLEKSLDDITVIYYELFLHQFH